MDVAKKPLDELRYAHQQQFQNILSGFDVSQKRLTYRLMRQLNDHEQRSNIFVPALGMTLSQIAVFSVLAPPRRC